MEDCGSPAGAVRRDSCGGACDHADHADSQEQHVEFTTESSKSLADMVKETTALNDDSNRTPSKSESDFAESSDERSSEEAKRPGAEDKEPETAGLGLETAGLGAGSADLPAG